MAVVGGGDVFCPFVFWGQSRDAVFLKVDINDIASGPEVDLTEDHLKFRAQGCGACGINQYGFKIDFYLPVDPKSSKYRVTGRAVEFECKKVGVGQVWPRLSEKAQKLPWLKTDFDRFAFDDSEASSEDDLSPQQREALDRMEKEALAEESNVVQDLKTLYLFMYNIFQWIGYCYVFGAISVRWYLYGNESRKDAFETLGPALMVCQSAAVLEVLHPLLGWVKTRVMANFMQVFSRGLVLFVLLAVEPKLQSHDLVWYLFLSWSFIEIMRYPYYMLASIEKQYGLVTWLRYTAWIPLYPMESVCEGLIMLMALPHFDRSNKWSINLPNNFNCSFHFTTFLRLYMVLFLFGVYFLMQQMYEQRKKKLNIPSNSKTKKA